MRPERTFHVLVVLSLVALALPVSLAARLLPLAVPAALGRPTEHPGGVLGAACSRLFVYLPGGAATVAALTGALLAASVAGSVWCLARQWRNGERLAAAVRAARRPLPRPFARRLRRNGLAGHVDLLDSGRPAAFTYGWRAPRICITSGLVALLEPDELDAVLRHERHHLTQRDPVRLFWARALAAGAIFVPALRDVQAHGLTLLELAADDAAVAAADGRGALARALYALVRYWRGEERMAHDEPGGSDAARDAAPLWWLAESAVTFGPQSPEVLDARIDHLVDPRQHPCVVWSPLRLMVTAGVLAAAGCLLLFL